MELELAAVLEAWFWQRIVTPHMMGLAAALAELKVSVTYVAEERMSTDRQRQGWLAPEEGGVQVVLADNRQSVRQLVAEAPDKSIHICQGIRANGLVGVAQAALSNRGLTQWVIMETVRDVGWRGVIKRYEYARLFNKRRGTVQGVLATGYRTQEWLAQRGVPVDNIFPFAYFLDKGDVTPIPVDINKPFKFIFVGQLIPRKRLDFLISALGELDRLEFELMVIGSGPLEDVLRHKSREVLGDKAIWIGRLPSDEVRNHMAKCDCLVLPSLYDGWGAVVSEALMCGTSVICSDTCGSAGIVKKSNVGGVFKAEDDNAFKATLKAAVQTGCVTRDQRSKTVAWSDVIAAKAGAKYLLDILTYRHGDKEKPQPPWRGAGEI
jgi:glycosyltransferase involved in cell wall biosynthesis